MQSHHQENLTPEDLTRLWYQLWEAVEKNNVDQVKRLMQGLSIADQISLMHLTCFLGSAPNILFLGAIRANDTFQELLNHLDNHALLPFLEQIDSAGVTVFHYVTTNQPNVVFKALLDKTDAKTLKPLLFITVSTLKNVRSVTLLHLAASWRSDIGFKALMDKIDDDTLNNLANLKDSIGNNLLHYASMNTDDSALEMLTDRIQPDKLQEMLFSKNDAGDIPFFQIINRVKRFRHFEKMGGDKTIKKFVEIPDEINTFQNLVFGVSTRQTFNQRIVYSEHTTFKKIVDEMSEKIISDTCCKDTSNFFECIIFFQPPDNIALVLNKVNDEALRKMLCSSKLSHRSLSILAGYLAHESSWQNEALIAKLFKYAEPVLTQKCCELYLAGKKLSRHVVTAALPQLRQLINNEKNVDHAHELKEIEKIWRDMADTKEGTEIKEVSNNPQITINLNSNTTLRISIDKVEDESIMRQLWTHGLQSPFAYHLLQRYFPNTPLTEMAHHLHRAGLLYSGCMASFELPSKVDIKPFQAIKDFNGVVKIVNPRNLSDFLKQMNNPSYRSQIRYAKDTRALVKFKHMKGEVENYKYVSDKKSKNYTHTTKQSISLLAPELNVSVFGEHHADILPTGFMFDWKQTKIKAMMDRDTWTTIRRWLGNRGSVECYQKYLEDINFTDETAFRERIRQKPQPINEVLGELSKGGTLAIVAASDTPQGREQARSYQQSFKEKCGIDLPIDIYNRGFRTMRQYSQEEQADDVMAKKLNLSSYSKLRQKHDIEKRTRELIQELRDHVRILEDNNHGPLPTNSIWSLPPRYLPKTILNSGKKLLSFFEKNPEVTTSFNEEELLALRNGRLGKIVAELEALNRLPNLFRKEDKRHRTASRVAFGRY